ncbi:MAG: DJ-1 family glyoxalase III [Opitutales bacterium]|jgi:4-methyl-5(b-hydroxyethyl)-thiazole monophosphate biosynthesis
MPATALVIIIDRVEELEAIAPIDCLRRAGVRVMVASAGEGLKVTGRNGIGLVADSLLVSCLGQSHDLVVVPGGPGHAQLAENEELLGLLREQHASGKLVASICAGPVVLDKAGVLEGKAFTSFPGTADILPGRDPSRRVVRDGNIITSQGAGTALEFALELVEALCGESVRREISASICA